MRPEDTQEPQALADIHTRHVIVGQNDVPSFRTQRFFKSGLGIDPTKMPGDSLLLQLPLNQQKVGLSVFDDENVDVVWHRNHPCGGSLVANQ